MSGDNFCNADLNVTYTALLMLWAEAPFTCLLIIFFLEVELKSWLIVNF